MSLKEKVDSYLISNIDNIQVLKLDKKFKWENVAKAIGVDIAGEYVRGRYRKLFKDNPKSVNYYKREDANINYNAVITTSDNGTITYTILNSKEDLDKGTKEFNFTADHIPTEEEIITHFNIDTVKYRINQIYHKTSFGGKYSITVSLLANKGNKLIKLDEDFLEKVSQLTPLPAIIQNKEGQSKKPKACLFIPKQDAHWNKLDEGGNNDMNSRFEKFTKALFSQLEKATLTNSIEEINYIIGSDEFNSEWTNQTTKGTPQSNLMSYEESFEKICEFNIETIKLLGYYAPKVNVILLNGNHDHNVSWHLAHLLKQVFKKSSNITINSELVNTKFISYKSNLIMINHGDVIKPKDLAAKFPIMAKEQWSSHSNYYLITGDKHHEVAHDFNGIMFYQVPQLSNAKSKWDDKMGFSTSKPELLTFLFEEDGLSNILRKNII